jgi:hypothetical protein
MALLFIVDSDSSALQDIQIFHPLSDWKSLFSRLCSHLSSLFSLGREGFFNGGFELLL